MTSARGALLGFAILPLVLALSPPQDQPRVFPAPGHLESSQCARCHSNSPFTDALRDGAGRPVAPYDLWRGSMMANSGRDPFWRAVVSAEIAHTPSKKALIEEKCTRCHTPMVRPVAESPPGRTLAVLDGDDDRARLARDGVSCTVCHRIAPDDLGTPASFTGRFTLEKDAFLYGPHSAPIPGPMPMFTGYTPAFGAQIGRSALCATCHTLITHALEPDGRDTGKVHHEQVPYLEWRNSVFNDEVDYPEPEAASCQACHLPTTDVDGDPIHAAIARNPRGGSFPFVAPRQPFGRHVLVGGNTLIPQILRDNRELGPTAPDAAFDATIAAARDQLRHRTATLAIADVSRADGVASFAVTVANRAGHKLPTAYPSRRVWLRVVVRDADGTIVFRSGDFDEAGRLVDGTGAVLASERVGGPIEPHHRVIEREDRVQIYESVMAGVDGKATFTLLRAAGFVKDNRLLPRGWEPDGPHAAETAPVGVAGDRDFADGGDTIRYRVRVVGAAPHRVEATLYYTVLSPRHAAELFEVDTPEVAAFRSLYEGADRTPERVATSTATIPAR